MTQAYSLAISTRLKHIYAISLKQILPTCPFGRHFAYFSLVPSQQLAPSSILSSGTIATVANYKVSTFIVCIKVKLYSLTSDLGTRFFFRSLSTLLLLLGIVILRPACSTFGTIATVYIHSYVCPHKLAKLYSTTLLADDKFSLACYEGLLVNVG